MKKLISYESIDFLSQAKSAEEIHLACAKFCDQFEFDRFVYLARLPTTFVNPRFILINGYPGEWCARYRAQGYRSVDPMVAHCASYATPISWEQIVPLEKEGKSIRQFMGEARSCGLNSGVSIPVHTPQGGVSILNLSSSKRYVCARPDILHAMPHAQLFAAYLHENVRKVFEQELGAWSRVHLTTRERECLLWTAEGKTS